MSYKLFFILYRVYGWKGKAGAVAGTMAGIKGIG